MRLITLPLLDHLSQQDFEDYHQKRLKAARQEFEHMLQQGIICPSSSNWASPLHMVPLVTGDHVVITELLIM